MFECLNKLKHWLILLKGNKTVIFFSFARAFLLIYDSLSSLSWFWRKQFHSSSVRFHLTRFFFYLGISSSMCWCRQKNENENAEQHVDHSNRSANSYANQHFLIFICSSASVVSCAEPDDRFGRTNARKSRIWTVCWGENVKIETNDDLKFMKMSKKSCNLRRYSLA